MPRGRNAYLVDGNLIDQNTGEIIEQTGVFYTTEQQEQARRYFEQQNRLAIERHRINEAYQEQGYYCWLLFQHGVALLPSLESAELMRLMFISTYHGYDGYLVFDNGKPIAKLQLFDLLGLSKSECKKLWKKLIDCEILREQEGKLYLSEEYFHRGELSPLFQREITDNIIRIYHNGGRELYHSVNTRSHKLAGSLYRLLPYLNRKYNIVCENPFEDELMLIHPMRWKDICILLGYNTDRPNQLKENLLSFTYGEGKRAVTYEEETSRIFVTPDLFYSGNNAEEIKLMGGF